MCHGPAAARRSSGGPDFARRRARQPLQLPPQHVPPQHGPPKTHMRAHPKQRKPAPHHGGLQREGAVVVVALRVLAQPLLDGAKAQRLALVVRQRLAAHDARILAVAPPHGVWLLVCGAPAARLLGVRAGAGAAVGRGAAGVRPAACREPGGGTPGWVWLLIPLITARPAALAVGAKGVQGCHGAHAARMRRAAAGGRPLPSPSCKPEAAPGPGPRCWSPKRAARKAGALCTQSSLCPGCLRRMRQDAHRARAQAQRRSAFCACAVCLHTRYTPCAPRHAINTLVAHP